MLANEPNEGSGRYDLALGMILSGVMGFVVFVAWFVCGEQYQLDEGEEM